MGQDQFHFIKFIFIFCCVFLTKNTQAQTIIYVDQAAEGTNNGSSWADAFTDLQAALSTANSGDEIWVARGIYYPASISGFNLKSGVKMYGGFTGEESASSERNIEANPTVLDGDLDKNGVLDANNAGRVVQISGVNNVLDGFVIRGGYNTGNSGGGIKIYYPWYSPPSSGSVYVRNCIIQDNYSPTGGGMSIQVFTNLAGEADKAHSLHFELENCIFDNNASSKDGGGIFYLCAGYNVSTTLTATNLTIINNSAKTGAGIYTQLLEFDADTGDTPSSISSSFRNTVFHNNKSIRTGNEYSANLWAYNVNNVPPVGTATQKADFCFFGDSPDSVSDISHTNSMVNMDPLLEGYRPVATSATLDQGNNFYVNGITTDFTGSNERVINSTVDIGAFEYDPSSPTISAISDQVINEDNSMVINFSVDDAEDTATVLIISASSLNEALIPVENIVFEGTGKDRTMTITPTADNSGVADIVITVMDSDGKTSSQSFLVTVNPVNDAPSLAKGEDQSVNEDAGLQTVANWATDMTDGDPEVAQTLTLSISNDNNALFLAQPDVNAVTGDLTYTPAADVHGSATVTLSLSDDGGTDNSGVDHSVYSFVIIVNSVNDAPSFTKGPDQTVNEDAGLQTVANWATDMTDGDPEVVQTLTFHVSNDNNDLFLVQPDVNAVTGDLTYTPSGDVPGSATVTLSLSDDGGTAHGGVDHSEVYSFVIIVNSVNDAPSFTKGPDLYANEDAGLQTVANWATDMTDGDPEVAQTLTLSISNDNNALFLVQPDLDMTTGDLTYTPAADVHGSATVTLSLSDDGDTANGGVDHSVYNFVIIVNSVNDAPSFTKGADQLVNADAGPQTVANWATDITDGDPEVIQTLTFHVSNDNNDLFLVQPHVNAVTGDLTYTPTTDALGVATVTLSISDNGGTANSGIDRSGDQTFEIVINSEPTGITLASTVIDENKPAGTVVGELNSTDPDAKDTFTYSLVAGLGDTDNSSFTITDTFVKTSEVFDFEVKNSCSIRIRTTDAIGFTFEKVFTITVNDITNQQTIIFNEIPDQDYAEGAFMLAATASSGLDVQFEVVSGPGIIEENLLTFTGTGAITVRASQPGNSDYLPADPVERTFNVMLVTGINDDIHPLCFNFYPNPVADFLNIEVDAGIPVTLMLLNMKGEQIVDLKNSKGVDVSHLGSGVYLLRLTTTDQSRIYKVYKQ